VGSKRSLLDLKREKYVGATG